MSTKMRTRVSVDTSGDIRSQILVALSRGPVRSFSSNREVDKVLQALRKREVIRYRKVRDGGYGWELIKA